MNSASKEYWRFLGSSNQRRNDWNEFISSLWDLIVHADDPFPILCGDINTNSGKRFVAAYRAHAGIYPKVFAGVVLGFALCLQGVFFGPNRTIDVATDLVTFRALLRRCLRNGGGYWWRWG